MRRRLVAARAILRQFETIRRVTTVLLGDVVALLALRAGQSDLGAKRPENLLATVVSLALFRRSSDLSNKELVAGAGLEPATSRL